jgi:predicted ATPase/class 3 adenylate cyclase
MGSAVSSAKIPVSRSDEARSDDATFVIVSASVCGTAAALSRFDHAVHMMPSLPSGIVTFLFTDIEGSTRLWERDSAAMIRAARRHDALLAAAIANHHGVLYKHVGDAVQAAFSTPIDAVSAAVDAQRALAAEPWPETGPIRARMAIHCGEATPNGHGDYHQVPSLNRLARLMASGHGGQVLLSDAIQEAVSTALPDSVTLLDLGRHRLRDLLEPELITQLVIAGLPSDFPPLKTLEGHPTNLPTLPTALLGRDKELSSIADLLVSDDTRLVTLVGPGGVGKTHLALQAAANLVDDFEDGVWLVRLGTVSEPQMILPAVAATVGVREGGGLDVREALLHWLGSKHLLFVFDNVEQVIAGAPAIAGLLAACPRVRILTTSRQRLGIGGERILPVQPLALAPMQATAAADIAQSAAVRLFAERASEIAPGFELNDRNATTVAALCARLDGLPLAIELAAAQLRGRTLPELVAGLERRFDVLVGGKREALTHQQSLAATIDWSYELLEPAAQRLLRCVSVFSGGWSPEAAEQVAAEVGSVRECMMALTEQSLIRHSILPDDSSRWSMFESIRAFGRERLQEAGEEAPVQDRHADWCLAFAEEASSNLDGSAQERWLARLDLEHDNARAALRWAADRSDAKRVLALATALAPYWQIRGYLSEGRRWLESALRDADQTSSTGLRAMVEAGVLAQTQGDFSAARAWYTLALDVARAIEDRGRESSLLNNLGAAALEQGDLDEAERRFTDGLLLAEALGDQRRRANALANLGATAHYRGDLDLALQRYLECLQIWRTVGDARGIADMLLNVLMLLAPLPTERQRARAAGEESLRLFRDLGEATGEALALSGLGHIASEEGNLELAASLHAESLQLARRIEDLATEARALGSLAVIDLDRANVDHAEDLLRRHLEAVNTLGDLDGVAFSLEAFAALYTARMDDERAARLYGAAGALRDRIAIAIPPVSLQRHESVAKTLAERLGDRFLNLVTEGSTLDPAQATVEALRRREASSSSDPLAESLQALDDVLGTIPTGAKRQLAT